MMRIAVCHNLPSGGGKRALYEIVSRMARRHEVDVYSLSTADHAYCDLRPHVNNHRVYDFRTAPLAGSPFGRVNPVLRTLDLYHLRTIYRNMADDIDAAGYDVVFVHNCRFGQSPSLLQHLRSPSAYYCAEPPRHLYESGVERHYAHRSRLQSMVDRLDPSEALHASTLKRFDQVNTRHADRVLTNSAYSRETLYRTYQLLASIVYLGVDPERFIPIDVPDEDFVLSVGAVQPHKGYDFVIDSLGHVDADVRPRLVIVGNASNQEEIHYLRTKAVEQDVDLEIKVSISDEELVALYNQALMTVYAPVMEPFGFVPLESSACGTPVVGVYEGGVRETIQDGCNGLLVERDAASFGRAIAGLLCDGSLRRHMGRNARCLALKQWSWDRSIQKFERHFSELM